MQIYLVEGHTGEWGDYRRWNVRAFLRRQDAECLVAHLNKIGNVGVKGLDCAKRQDVQRQLSLAGDPEAHTDYTGTRYFVSELELI